MRIEITVVPRVTYQVDITANNKILFTYRPEKDLITALEEVISHLQHWKRIKDPVCFIGDFLKAAKAVKKQYYSDYPPQHE